MLPLLADFAPLSPAAQWTFVSLLGVALTLTLLWSNFRRNPPLDSELVKLSLSIEGLQKSFADLNAAMKAHAAHATEIEALKQKVCLLEEHRERDLYAQRTYTRETTRELFVKLDEQGIRTQEKLDALTTSLNANFASFENRLGRVDGSIEQLTSRINLVRPTP